MVVNAMWGAGAEAVSINGQRIGPTTFVRTAGSVILVNITPVSSPYVVSAIGTRTRCPSPSYAATRATICPQPNR